MLSKVTFSLNLFFYSSLRYFTKTRPYLLSRLQDASDPDNLYLSYTAIIKIAKKRYGWSGVVLANIGLSLFGILLMILIDKATVHFSYAWWCQLIFDLTAAVYCCIKFDVIHPVNPVSMLKLFYIIYSAVNFFSWGITYIFLLIFENVIML